LIKSQIQQIDLLGQSTYPENTIYVVIEQYLEQI